MPIPSCPSEQQFPWFVGTSRRCAPCTGPQTREKHRFSTRSIFFFPIKKSVRNLGFRRIFQNTYSKRFPVEHVSWLWFFASFSLPGCPVGGISALKVRSPLQWPARSGFAPDSISLHLFNSYIYKTVYQGVSPLSMQFSFFLLFPKGSVPRYCPCARIIFSLCSFCKYGNRKRQLREPPKLSIIFTWFTFLQNGPAGGHKRDKAQAHELRDEYARN